MLTLLAGQIVQGAVANETAEENLRRLLEAKLHAQQEATIREVAGRIAERGEVSFRDSAWLEEAFFDRVEGELRARSVEERRAFSTKVLGESLYAALRGALVRYVASGEPSGEVIPAIQLLGTVLFSQEDVDVIRSYVFNADERVQMQALCSLCALDVPGARGLLHYALLSGVVDELWICRACNVLIQYDDTNLLPIAQLMLKARRGPLVISSVLPVLLKGDDCLALVETLLASGDYEPPDTKTLDLNGMARVRIARECMNAVMSKNLDLANNPIVKEKIIAYAESNTHQLLYQIALLLLDIRGSPTTYFEELASRPGIPVAKATFLRKMIEKRKSGADASK